jgi:hypothetical protein
MISTLNEDRNVQKELRGCTDHEVLSHVIGCDPKGNPTVLHKIVRAFRKIVISTISEEVSDDPFYLSRCLEGSEKVRTCR